MFGDRDLPDAMGSLQRSPKPLSWIWGGDGSKGRIGRERDGERERVGENGRDEASKGKGEGQEA